MEWNVYFYDCNANEIVGWNIFNHSRFLKEIIILLDKDDIEFESFSEELRKILFYYFRHKTEYEILISPWCGKHDSKLIKIDIYSQIMINWKAFSDYIWSYSKVVLGV